MTSTMARRTNILNIQDEKLRRKETLNQYLFRRN